MGDRCTATTKAGAPCPMPAADGRAWCLKHDRHLAAERGRRGGQARGAKERAERAAHVAAVRLDAVATLQDAVTHAYRAAYAEGDNATAVAAVRAATELLKVGDLERTVAELREIVEAHVKRGPIGVVR